MKIFTRYDVPSCPGIKNSSESMTQQQFKDEVNIDGIIQRYHITGVLPADVVREPGQYGDFSDVPSFMEANNIILQAEEDFMSLPSNVRKRFDNDPLKYLEFFNDSNNYDEAVSLGLCVKKDVDLQKDVLQKDVLEK